MPIDSDAGTGEHRPGRDLVAVPPRNGRARRYGALALGLLLYGPVITCDDRNFVPVPAHILSRKRPGAGYGPCRCERRSCSLNLNVRQLQLAATRTIDERRVPDIDATSEMLQASGTPPDLPNRRSSVGAGRGRMVACRGNPAVIGGIVQREA